MKSSDRTSGRTNVWLFSLKLGFYAGLIWGGVLLLFHYLQFMRIVPGFLVEPFFKHAFLETWTGHAAGWLFFILFSVFSSLLYGLLLRKRKGPWPGMIYGLFWWGLLFLAAGPWLGMTKPLWQLDRDTIITTLCLFVLWGLFIGYTIAYEFTEERSDH